MAARSARVGNLMLASELQRIFIASEQVGGVGVGLHSARSAHIVSIDFI